MARLEDILPRTLAGMDYECVDFELTPRGTLRIFIDRLDRAPVTLDDCVRASGQLGRVLAVENVDYRNLEVSSPGVDRVLKKEKDFLRFRGSRVKIRALRPIDGRLNFSGRIIDCRDGVATIDLGGADGEVGIELDNVRRARLDPEI